MDNQTIELMRTLTLENQFKVRSILSELEKCSPEQLKDLCLYYATSLFKRDETLKEMAHNWAKGENNQLS